MSLSFLKNEIPRPAIRMGVGSIQNHPGMFSVKKLLPVVAVAALVASVFLATRPKTSEEPVKEAVTVRSSPSSPVPLFPKRSVSRERAPRDVLSTRMRNDFDLQERGYLAARQGMDEVIEILSECKSDRDHESFLSGAFRRAADLGVRLSGNWIDGVIPGSPAGRAGLVDGDRIIAFTSADGQWVEANGADVMGLINGLRGAAHTSVTIRVSAEDGGQSRDVTLTRGQLMMQER